jgi:peptidoglycan-N-acetylglucosamine deacetylase
MFYLIRMPWWLKKIYPASLIWRMPAPAAPLASSLLSPKDKKILYLSFDDGPHPVVTPWVLEELRKYGARGTFFCIGKNVQEYPQIYRSILLDGHRVGNHTQNHLNGWKTDDGIYLDNVREAARLIDSDLFRPPYGRISRFQCALLQRSTSLRSSSSRSLSSRSTSSRSTSSGLPSPFKIIMWDVLSGDFDRSISGERCARNVIRYGRQGSIVVFHDSEKAFDRLRVALPAVLEHFSRLGYRFESVG